MIVIVLVVGETGGVDGFQIPIGINPLTTGYQSEVNSCTRSMTQPGTWIWPSVLAAALAARAEPPNPAFTSALNTFAMALPTSLLTIFLSMVNTVMSMSVGAGRCTSKAGFPVDVDGGGGGAPVVETNVAAVDVETSEEEDEFVCVVVDALDEVNEDHGIEGKLVIDAGDEAGTIGCGLVTGTDGGNVGTMGDGFAGGTPSSVTRGVVLGALPLLATLLLFCASRGL